jgi:hypothetical protein
VLAVEPYLGSDKVVVETFLSLVRLLPLSEEGALELCKTGCIAVPPEGWFAAVDELADNQLALERLLLRLGLELGGDFNPFHYSNTYAWGRGGRERELFTHQDTELASLRLDRESKSDPAHPTQVQLERARLFFHGLMVVLGVTQSTWFVECFHDHWLDVMGRWLKRVADVVNRTYGGGLVLRDHRRGAMLVQAFTAVCKRFVSGVNTQEVEELEEAVKGPSLSTVRGCLHVAAWAVRVLSRAWAKCGPNITPERYRFSNGIWHESMSGVLQEAVAVFKMAVTEEDGRVAYFFDLPCPLLNTFGSDAKAFRVYVNALDCMAFTVQNIPDFSVAP